VRETAASLIILIRHGQTTTNAQGLLVGRTDPDLTELGERQALALRPYLAGVEEVWTSPLKRARDTAALALPDLEAVVHPEFIEVDYGLLDGQPISDVTGAQWRELESDHSLALGNGESLASVDQRVHASLDALLANTSSLLHELTRHVAIVSHVSPIKSATTWAVGVPGSVAWRLRLDNGSITTITMRHKLPALVRYNAVPAL
jgi:broad specificity phosphatase PhoE